MVIGVYVVVIIGVKMLIYVGFLIVIFVGIFVVGGIVLGVGIFILRLKGDYLVIVILGVVEIICILLVNGGDIMNGVVGIMGILFFIIWFLVYGVVVVSFIFVMNFLCSFLGCNIIVIWEDEIVVEFMGVDIIKVKVIVFIFGVILVFIVGSL